MNTLNPLRVSLLVALVLTTLPGLAADSSGSAKSLLQKTNTHGGICLVIGADDPALAAALASESALYVQLLQPDFQTATAWGRQVASGKQREQIGVRNAAFNASQYGSDLFNLIVVEQSEALGKATITDLERMLVPNGTVAFRSVPDGFGSIAKQLGMAAGKSGPLATFRKAVKPAEWKLPLAKKWSAGPRSQIANGYTGIVTGGGKLFYMERMERNSGNLNKSAAVVFARDASNGRTLWSWVAPGGWNRYNGLATGRDGRLFARTGDHKVYCLDGATGKVLFEAIPKVSREARIKRLNDDLFWVGGDVHSTQTGKRIWRMPRFRYQPLKETILGNAAFFCDGKTLMARNLADGKELWTKPLPTLPGPYAGLGRAGDTLLIRMKGKAKDQFLIGALDQTDGKLLWSYAMKVHVGKEPYFDAGKVRTTSVGDKLLIYYRHNQAGSYADEVVVTRLDLATGKEELKDKVLKDAGDYHGCFSQKHLGDYIAYYDLWIHKKTLETTLLKIPHPACFFGMKTDDRRIFNFPSRKSGPISAVGPADAPVDRKPIGKTFLKFGRATSKAATQPGDWPMFRGRPSGGNFSKASLGTKLVKAWETPIGLGANDFAVMSSQRTGLTQPVSAYGLVVVSDIDAQRIVAVSAENGKQKWAFHVGSRVDFSPTLTKGLCLFTARDGWVYAVDALTGSLVWKRLVASRERFIGGREKLESTWPLASDVLIASGIAYVSGGGANGVAFNPETGVLVEALKPGDIALGRRSFEGGRELMLSYDIVIKGNSIPRTNEDNWHGFRRQRFQKKLDARVLAFDDALTVAYTFKPKGEGWANKGTLQLSAVTDDPKKPIWKTPAIELVVDDMVLTPKYIYCVGHYQRVKKSPELWVVSREDGKVVSTIPIDGFPAFLGMSLAGNRLFISTREGKLICCGGKP